LRIEVNGELDALERGLSSAIAWLAPGGRVAVISYHSLEDRIVKHVFAESARGCTCPPGLPVCTCGSEPVVDIVTRRAIVPASDEIEGNPRARSAKLRVAEKK
jgi:16S rRNA (cytosine1402-N4)-methyltransferase